MNQQLNLKTKPELIAECERLLIGNTRAKREPLTDEAILELVKDLLKPGTIWAVINDNQLLINEEQALAFARAIEAAHGIGDE